jgi:PatG Domain
VEAESNENQTRTEDTAKRVTPQRYSQCQAMTAENGVLDTPSWIYAIGKVEARFPSVAIEKEYTQVLGREQASGATDRQAMHTVMSKLENRYLARQLCWVMTIEGLETYLLYPRDPADLSLLVETIRPNPHPTDLDIVIGRKGPVASPDMCNGLMVPIVAFDQIYSLDRDTLIKSIPKPENVSPESFGPAAAELFDRIMFMADNAGSTDEHRALNYLTVRYPAIYSTAAESFARNESLDGVEVRPSALSGARNIIEAIFSFRNRTTDVLEKFFTRVDVTEEFPFLVTKMSPYYER